MTNLEMVELLRDKAGITYEEAKEVLEQTNWDPLEAVLLLEKQGRTPPGGGAYSTEDAREESQPHARKGHKGAKRAANRLGRTIHKLVHAGNANHFVITRRGDELLSLPVTAFALILVFTFWFSLIALVIGLFCGLRYSFRGPNLGKQSINDVIDRAADMADSVREDLLREQHAPTDEEK